MKYVVLSFDDGFLSFKDIVLPILDKYSMKSSINIITGFSDNSISNRYPRLSINDIKELYSNGHEIALHTNAHLKPTTCCDFSVGYDKLKEWLPEDKFGAIIPYSQPISSRVLNYLSKTCLYVSDYHHNQSKRSIKEFIFRARNYIFRTSFGNNVVSFHRFIYNNKSIDFSCPKFIRLAARKSIKPDEIIKCISLCSNGSCLTIAFHSIINDLSESVEWPDGAWLAKDFDKLLYCLKKDKNISVLTQKELFNAIKNNRI